MAPDLSQEDRQLIADTPIREGSLPAEFRDLHSPRLAARRPWSKPWPLVRHRPLELGTSAAGTPAYGESVATANAPPHDGERLAGLTPREHEMVALVATGLSNQEIAEHMFLSPFTVRAHVQRSMMKLRARDRAQLVVIAYRTGLAPAAAPDRGAPGRPDRAT